MIKVASGVDLQGILKDLEDLSESTGDVQWVLVNETDVDFHDGVGGAEYGSGGGVLTSISVGPRTSSKKTVAVSTCVKTMAALLYHRYNGKVKAFRLQDRKAPSGKCWRTVGWKIVYKDSFTDGEASFEVLPIEHFEDE